MPANDPARAQRMRAEAKRYEAVAADLQAYINRVGLERVPISLTQQPEVARLIADALRIAAAVLSDPELADDMRGMMLAHNDDCDCVPCALWTRTAVVLEAAALAGTPSAPDEGEEEQ